MWIFGLSCSMTLKRICGILWRTSYSYMCGIRPLSGQLMDTPIKSIKYKAQNWFLKAIEAMKTKEAVSKNGKWYMLHHGVLFSYFRKERMFVLVQPFVRKYHTERGKKFCRGLLQKWVIVLIKLKWKNKV